MSTPIASKLKDMRILVSNERQRIGFFVAAILIGIIGFEAGILRNGMNSSAPLVIEKPVGELAAADCTSTGTVAGASAETTFSSAQKPGSEGCKFIGSKNSTLYHAPSCAVAKRIKPENIVCFADEAAATAKGYKPGCLK
ncbi:MAG: Ada metal-binding domain-containing protein [Candidatus Moraniibacteriota bacterium]